MAYDRNSLPNNESQSANDQGTHERKDRKWLYYDNPDNELKVGGMVPMSVWELVLLRLGASESVGIVLKLVEFALVVMLKVVRLKLPVVGKRAVASRTGAGQSSVQAPAINYCLTTQSTEC